MKKIVLLFMLFVILFIVTGCLKDRREEEKIQKDEEVILEKVLRDIKLYNNEKRVIDDTIIGEGIYINVLVTDKLSGYEGWYYYSNEDLLELYKDKTKELVQLMSICAPKGRVYCVYGDKGVEIYDYKSIEETKLKGEELKIDLSEKIKKVDKNGVVEVKIIETGKENSKKAYLIDYPVVTKSGIIIKYEKEILEKTEVEFYNDIITTNSAAITVIEDGVAKIDIDLIGGKYNIKSNNIYFGKYNEIEINEYDVDISINYDKDISDYIVTDMEEPIIKNFLKLESDVSEYYVDIEFDTIPDYIIYKEEDWDFHKYALFTELEDGKIRIYIIGSKNVEILPIKDKQNDLNIKKNNSDDKKIFEIIENINGEFKINLDLTPLPLSNSKNTERQFYINFNSSKMTEKDINNKLNKNIDQLKMINENEIRENNLSNGRHTIAILGIERKNEDKLIRRIVWEQDVFINKLDLSREKIKEIAEKYSPILSFNEKEKYFPMSLEEMFSDLTLEEKKLRIRYHKLRNFAYKLNKKYQIIHFDDLKNILPYNGHRNALLDVYAPESVFLDALSRRKGDINNITVYYSLIEREGKYYLNYHFLYPYDPKGGGIPSVTGIHLFDRESCTIVLNENMYPEKILYGAHLEGQKMWLSENGNEKPKWNGGRVSIEWNKSLRYGEHPVLAIAKGAHAIYPVNGEYSFNPISFNPSDSFMVFSETAGGIENIENFLVYPSIFAKKSKNIKGYRIENLLNEDFENGKSVLNFSGYYVDILGKNNAKFPPFTSREINPSEYVRGESVDGTALAFEGFKINNSLPENCVKQFKNLIGSLAVEDNSIKYIEDKIKSTEIDLKWESKVGGNINSDLDGYIIYRKSNIEGETEYKNIGIIQKKYNEKDECIGYNIYNKINTNEIYKKINPIGTIGYNNGLFEGLEFGYEEKFKEFLYRDLMLIPETEYEYKIVGFTKLEEYYVTENGIKDENKNQYVEGIIEDTSIKLVTKKLEKPKSINYGVNEREEFEILIEESKEIEEMKESIKKAGDLIEEEIEIGYILEYSEELNPNEEDYIEKLRIIWNKSIEKYKLTEDSVEIIEELEKLKLKIYDNPNNTYRIKSYIRYNNKKIEKQSEYKYAETEGIKIKKMIIDYSRKEISEKEKYGQVYFEYEYPNEVSEYKIYIKNEIGNYEEIGITAEKNYTYKSENLKPKEKYYYKIVPSDLTMDKVKEIEVEIPIEFPEMEVLKKEIKFTYAEVYITKPIELINSGYELKFNYLRTMATNGTIYSLSLTEEDEYCNLNNAYKFMSDKNMFQSGITFHNIEVYLMRYEKYDTENNITYRTYLRNDYLFKANN